MSDKLIREVTAQEFGDLLRGSRPVFVDFFATWCGPCKAMEPVVERLAQEFYGRAEFIKVNIDKSPDLATEHGVRGVPTFLLFVGGQATKRSVGIVGERALASLIESHVEPYQETEAPTAA